MTLSIRPLDATIAPAWDRFVNYSQTGTFFHRAGWAEVIERAFGHETHYVCVERDGSITGVLPLARVRTRLFGDSLISAPFCVYGGPLAADVESAAALITHAERLLQRSGAQALEFRQLHDAAWLHREDWVQRPDLYVTFHKAISADHDRNMQAIPRKQRAVVRKGIQNGLVSIVNHDANLLHSVYAASVRNLGTPVFSRKYFRLLLEIFRDESDVITVMDGETPIASVMNFYFREEVLPYYGGGTQAARGRAGNDFMYWEVMRKAADRGCRLFDFGRSKIGTGAFAFKHNWGFAETKLRYYFRLKPGQQIPDHNPTNPKYRLFIEGWKRLPLPVTNTLGPLIVRGLG